MFRMIALMIMAVFAALPAAASAAASQKQTFGQWESFTDPGLWSAQTATDSGALFGLNCGEICVYYVRFRNPCVTGRKYDLVLSSQAGTRKTEAACTSDGHSQYLLIKDPGVDALMAGANIAVSLPAGGGRSQVSIFSLTGAKEALASVRQRWAQRPPRIDVVTPPPMILAPPTIRGYPGPGPAAGNRKDVNQTTSGEARDEIL